MADTYARSRLAARVNMANDGTVMLYLATASVRKM